MKQIVCPSCGETVPIPSSAGKKWAIGCLIAIAAIIPITAVVGLLAAIAIPSFVKARGTAQFNGCINNMRMIDSCKEQAALQYKHRVGAQIPNAQISEFSPRPMAQIICPSGGKYTSNPLGSDPQCSLHGTLGNPTPR
jgi:hypothetical protein